MKYADVVAGAVGDVNQVRDGIDGDGDRTRGVGIRNDVGAQVAAIDNQNAIGAGDVGEVGYGIDGDRGEAAEGSAVGDAIAGNGVEHSIGVIEVVENEELAVGRINGDGARMRREAGERLIAGRCADTKYGGEGSQCLRGGAGEESRVGDGIEGEGGETGGVAVGDLRGVPDAPSISVTKSSPLFKT